MTEEEHRVVEAELRKADEAPPPPIQAQIAATPQEPATNDQSASASGDTSGATS